MTTLKRSEPLSLQCACHVSRNRWRRCSLAPPPGLQSESFPCSDGGDYPPLAEGRGLSLEAAGGTGREQGEEEKKKDWYNKSGCRCAAQFSLTPSLWTKTEKGERAFHSFRAQATYSVLSPWRGSVHHNTHFFFTFFFCCKSEIGDISRSETLRDLRAAKFVSRWVAWHFFKRTWEPDRVSSPNAWCGILSWNGEFSNAKVHVWESNGPRDKERRNLYVKQQQWCWQQ